MKKRYDFSEAKPNPYAKRLLNDRFVDHARYGILRRDWVSGA